MRYTYIELSKYLHALSAVGIVYFFLNESIENALIYILFCCIFYFLSYIVFYKINSIFIKLNFILLYVGYLLSMPILFYNKGDYEEYGWKGIGAYKFDHVQTFDALTVVTIYLVLFVIIALIVDMALLKSYKVRSFGKNINYFNDLSRFSKYSSIFLFLLILQFYLSYLMF